MFENFDLRVALLIFVAYIFIDGLYAYYTLSVVQLKPLRSATTGLTIHLLVAFGVINYVGNPIYIIPLAIGSWVGTYFMVSREKSWSIAGKRLGQNKPSQPEQVE